MPSRPRPNKVTKPAPGSGARRGSRQSSLSAAAQEQLQQYAKEAANSNANHEATTLDTPISERDAIDESPIETGDKFTAINMLANGGAMTSIHTSLSALRSADDFQLDHQMPDHSSPEDPAARTAADLAYAAYGDLVKIDSALCKKLAAEIALREPTQRRVDQKLNIERRSNVEALLAHMTGQAAPKPCKNCHKGHGPWTQCVVYDGQMCGSCTNCWFNASGSRCTFHENNHQQPQALFAASVTASQANLLPFSQAALSQSTPSPNVNLSADINHWGLSDSTKQLITQTITDVATFSRRDRFLARIEAAAKELGMRIAEYEEYLRTPEGMAEQGAALERERAQNSHTQATEASMADAPSDEVLS
ncbi:hypothetical protein TARUN_3211 [Trichoderma arundinaceum]|uniref:Uncharacterized protein n=1 Tax=Trichoderma arundinaceum TaxID=490622 RepID=A0A395NSJ3_TRIAR|nr:hypothetical protein TARUN_3211 [Trichoderma arundinaceum]